MENMRVITTSFLDHHNDYIEVYVMEVEPDKFKLSDDGYNISDLRLIGCLNNDSEHNSKLQMIVDDFGINHDRNELFVYANSNNFQKKKHSLIQAIIAINSFFYYLGK